jgi:hypothetical protein
LSQLILKVVFGQLELSYPIKTFHSFGKEISTSFFIRRLLFFLALGFSGGTTFIRALPFSIGVELHLDEEVKRRQVHIEDSKVPLTLLDPADLVLGDVAFGFDTVSDLAIPNETLASFISYLD